MKWQFPGREWRRAVTMNGMPRERSFRLEELQPDEFLERLGERFRLRHESARALQRTFTDTFDWRLYRAGHVLSHVRCGRSRVLELADLGGGPVRRVAGNGLPAFRDDLPNPLSGELARIIDVRRLLPLVRVDVDESEHAVLDDEGKTVARIVLEQGTARDPRANAEPATLPDVVHVRPLRGYEREFDETANWLAEDLGLPSRAVTGIDVALAATGRSARDYTSKLNVELDPRERSDRALKRVLASLAQTIECNTPGTIADLDSEFLHDLRVATRRTRVALSRVKHVLPAEASARFGAEFRWLGGVTGPTRDLDVLLLKQDEYFGFLAAPERATLQPLSERIAEERGRAQRKLARALSSTRFLDWIASWRAFLVEPDEARPEAAKALVPIGELAAKRLRKTFAATLVVGGAVDASSPDADIHALRIQCKKLRYLLEFFRSLYPPAEIDALVKALKGLQNVLGDFNDYSVHRDYLSGLAPSLPGGVELALGALCEQLRLKKKHERERFEERFRKFAGDENQERAQSLFGQRGRR